MPTSHYDVLVKILIEVVSRHIALAYLWFVTQAIYTSYKRDGVGLFGCACKVHASRESSRRFVNTADYSAFVICQEGCRVVFGGGGATGQEEKDNPRCQLKCHLADLCPSM